MPSAQESPRLYVVLHWLHQIGQLILLPQQPCFLFHQLFYLVRLLLQLYQVLVSFAGELARAQLKHIDLPLLFRDLSCFSIQCLHSYTLLILIAHKLLCPLSHHHFSIFCPLPHQLGFLLDLINADLACIHSRFLCAFFVFVSQLFSQSEVSRSAFSRQIFQILSIYS